MMATLAFNELKKLSRRNFFYAITEMTGIGETTVLNIVNEVCKIMVEKLWVDFAEKLFPIIEEDFREKKMQGMGAKWQFVYAFSPIDGSYNPITCPPEGAEIMNQYHNYKNFYSAVLLVLADAQDRYIREKSCSSRKYP